jgi:hypothetical protein
MIAPTGPVTRTEDGPMLECTHPRVRLPARVPSQYEGVCLTCLSHGIRLPDGQVLHVEFAASEREAGG